ncbi:AraC family transcriptional regulator [Pontibacter kalidii]|uniref:AraC family transcriptional regulator n=1 Tax=Pontibacter kalidii TaxID=2592049 RepID=UPI00224E15FA|nr:AraC family transcriptional regulator [Pontibacter kalidii]
MKSGIDIKTDAELFENQSYFSGLRKRVNSFYLNNGGISSFIGTSVYLKSSMFILVLSGSGRLQINFKEYELEQDNMLLLSFGHFFMFTHVSTDFRCKCLYIGKEFSDEMYSTDMLYKRVKYGVRMHSIPVLDLNPEKAGLLNKRMLFTEEMLAEPTHNYYKEMVLNALLIFLLDLSNIIENERSISQRPNLSRDEFIIQSFIELLADHYKTEHHVSFYANQLHITPHYLTLVVKRITGQTVANFIFQMLYSEARLLLQQPRLSIQQIADMLHFSDQSAFGKFFRRKSGLSPRQFRKEREIL